MRARFPAALLPLLAAACNAEVAPTPGESARAAPVETIRLATTTSTRDSGLLEAILPQLEKDTGVRVTVLAVGTGQALRIGADGDADLLLTHDPKGEEEFLASGAGTDRRPFAFNDFVIVGPEADPAGIRGGRDAAAALKAIAAAGAPYLSRGDDSGTHRKERRLLAAGGVEPKGRWYRETGQGMSATLAMAAELRNYTLTDRSTWIAHPAAKDLPVLVEGDPALRNPYSVMLVNPATHAGGKSAAARKAADWLTGPRGRAAIEGFRLRDRQVFFLFPGP